MFDLKLYLEQKCRMVNHALDNVFDSSFGSPRIVQAMRFSLLSGGKRIRPVLCLAAADAVGKTGSSVMAAACALEMIHTYSLIHDDLPAMDDDTLRRGNPTCHVAFDEATAVLAGDALLTLAFQTLSTIHPSSEIESDKLLDVIHFISKAAGYQGMVHGQMLDVDTEGSRLELNELQAMHRLKTGALIEASVYAGAVLGGGDADQSRCLSEYARCIGLAFQVADDILNVEGDPVIMGKAVGTDANRLKNTYPALMGLEGSRSFARNLIQDALKAIEYFDNKTEPLRAIARYIVERKR